MRSQFIPFCASPTESRDVVVACLGKELRVEAWLANWNRMRKQGDTPNKIEVIELRSDPKYGKFFTHKPATARVEVRRVKDKAGDKLVVEVKDFLSPSKRVLTSSDVSSLWSTRAQAAIEKIRSEFSYVKADGHTLAVQSDAGRVDWFNFAGGVANDIISSHLARTAGIACQANDLALSFPACPDSAKLLQQLSALEIVIANLSGCWNGDTAQPFVLRA